MHTSPEFARAVDDVKHLYAADPQRVFKEIIDAFDMLRAQSFSRFAHISDYGRALLVAKEQLVNSRPGAGRIRTLLDVLVNKDMLARFTSMTKLDAHVQQKIAYAKSHHERVMTAIPNLSALKIKNGSVVFAYGYASEIVQAAVDAKSAGRRFMMMTTECRPYLLGRRLARECAQHNVAVEILVDAAMRIGIKRADIIFISDVCIDHHMKVYGTMGVELVAQIAKQYDVPVYVLTDSWACYPFIGTYIDESIGVADTSAVWMDAPTGVQPVSYAYEKIDPALINGIITEFGIVKPADFIAQRKKHHPLLD